MRRAWTEGTGNARSETAMRHIIGIAIALALGLLTAHLARRKHREVVVWGILGAVAPLVALIVLALHNCQASLQQRL